MRKPFFHFLYYGLARHLPVWVAPGGSFFRALRGAAARPLLGRCGHGVVIGRGAAFENPEEIRIGDHSALGINAWIQGPVEIGADVMMGANCEIYSHNHVFHRIDVPMRKQGFSESRVSIGDDVWIGSRVIILPGVTIGRGAVIGAGSVVPRSIPEYAVAAGNPARVVKYRRGAPGILAS